ncbi:MAG: hypothetical protein ABIY90_19500 [Puia sp.]
MIRKKNLRIRTHSVTAFLAIILGSFQVANASGIVIENDRFLYEIQSDGQNLHFRDKISNLDFLDTRIASFCASIKKNGQEYSVTSVSLEGSRLKYRFGVSGISAEIRIVRAKGYIRFVVREISAPVESFTFLNIPLTLKGMPDEPFGVCALALNPYTHVRELPALQTQVWANCYDRFGVKGAEIALLAVSVRDMLPLIRKVMAADKSIPHSDAGGAWAANNPEGRGSYLMNFGSLTEQTADTWIKMCRNLGFNQIDNHGGGFFNFGELKIDRKRFPGGWADFKKINKKLNDSGISSIFHTYSFFIDKNAKYVTPVASPELGYFNSFTLAESLDSTDSTITVNEPTGDISTVTGFFVRNSIALRIDGEIIEFTGVTKSAPYRFTGCRRGAFGTRKTAHEAGEKAYHLKELYGRFAPDPHSVLFREIAKKTADIVNEAGFNGIYLDAIDGSDILGGPDDFWYYGSQFIFEIARNLKRPVGMEMSSMSHFWWHYRSRWQAWDMPFRGYKRFVDIHLAAIKSPDIFLGAAIKSNDFEHGIWRGDTSLINKYAPLENGSLLLPLNLGWWGNEIADPPQVETTFPDDIEYLCGKLIGNDAGIAMLGGFDEGTLKHIPLFQRLDSIMRQYEGLRLAHYFNDSVRALLRQPGKEFRLFRQSDSSWNFRPVVYEKHKVEGADPSSAKWSINNAFSAQPLQLRIEALMSVKGYDDPQAVTLTEFGAGGEFIDSGSAAGVSGGIIPSVEGFRPGMRSGKFFAQSSGLSPARGAWVHIDKPFDPVLDIGNNQGLGVWIKGDSSGQLLNLRLESPKYLSHGARGDHFVKIDFKGWRYFELIEIESSEFSNYIWPVSDFYVYDSYRHTIGFKNIDRLQLWYNNLQPGKLVSCLLGPVRALPLVIKAIQNPTITVNGRKIVFYVTMKSGMYLELNSATDCRLYGSKGELLQQVQLSGNLPSVQPGMNEISFSCDDGEKNVLPRILVTVVNEGDPLKK